MLQLAGTWATQDTHSSTDSTECALDETPEAPESRRENPSRILYLQGSHEVAQQQICWQSPAL